MIFTDTIHLGSPSLWVKQFNYTKNDEDTTYVGIVQILQGAWIFPALVRSCLFHLQKYTFFMVPVLGERGRWAWRDEACQNILLRATASSEKNKGV